MCLLKRTGVPARNVIPQRSPAGDASAEGARVGAARGREADALSGGRRLNLAALELVGLGHLHVPSEPELLESSNHPPGEVDLPAAKAVTGRGGKGVVVVVPALAEN